MRKDFIFDFETIGQDVFQVPVINCSYYAFSWDRFLENPYTFKELVDNVEYIKADIQEQVETYKYKYKKDDLDFWISQPKKVQSKIKPSKHDLKLKSFVQKMVDYIRVNGTISYWWSRSNTFDPILLYRIADDTGYKDEINELLKFWAVRDVRTFVDAKFNFKTKNGFVPISDEEYWNRNFQLHNSIHDVAADILRLQTIYRVENDLEQTER